MVKDSFHKIKLLQRIRRTPTVESFRFTSDDKIKFYSGQFLKIIFDEEDLNNKELNKYLSFSNSPLRNYIEVTKRLSQSEFSKRLKSLNIDDYLLIQAPLGNCIFKEEYKKIAFLIGGIGITPVISIVEYIVDRNLDTEVVVFYSNRTSEDIPFKEELDNWQASNSNIKVIYTLGNIDKELLIREFKYFTERIFFIFGPPKMVEAMVELCAQLGISKDNTKTETFLGY
ncbi:MAG: FAD-dependent oxidoreductase [Candidatus Omnitrophica bacterium]|nr:FAD-dependent oxidoreductase [Candidatus Omnitrophota bacterium]